MRIKCYAIYDGEKQLVSEYANISQKNFIDYELKNLSKRLKKSERIEFQHTSNGVWYYKLSDKSKNWHFVLIEKEAASLSVASSMITKGLQLQASKLNQQKLRMKLAEQIKMINANTKIDTLSGNVIQLQGLMKGNVNKIINNMGDLQNVERKSQMMTNLSIQLERDSKKLEQKMKRKQCIRQIVIGGIAGLIVIFLFYYFFM